MKDLYNEYIKRLINVNDEAKTEQEHFRLTTEFYGWKQGVEDATGRWFNGDYYYINLIDNNLMKERPMCCGEFLDWNQKG